MLRDPRSGNRHHQRRGGKKYSYVSHFTYSSVVYLDGYSGRTTTVASR